MKDIYLTYDALQLAADEDFISWVKAGTPEETAAMEAWLDQYPAQRPAVEEARRLVAGMSFQVRRPEVDTDQLWSRIQTSNRQTAAVVPIRSRRRFLYMAGSAAAAVALLLFVIFGLEPSGKVTTDYGEHLAHVLPDQSNVQINAGSTLSYDKSGREIELEGEAYFEVTKGEHFRVSTDLGQVQVLGTKFNVFSREDRFYVQCTEGRVQVTAPGDREGMVLTAGMACELNTAGTLDTVPPVDNDSNIGWLENIYRFKKRPLAEIFAELERQFNVRVEVSDKIASQVHTGFFTGESLESALYQVCYPQALSYKIEGKQIRIKEDVSD
ncbi:MAG: FecR domain-containing protein [Saprospiraceae bacterium]|nr:FecR domain-containing protein [Lewinella sp.]